MSADATTVADIFRLKRELNVLRRVLGPQLGVERARVLGEEVPLEVSGGKAPFRWLVDGKPLAAAQPRRPIYWQPDGVGFAQLAVIDAEGRSARSTVRLSP